MRRIYSAFVDTGVMLEDDTRRERLLLASIGLAGETGEVVDHIKKDVFHGKPVDMDKVLLELGDVMWYYTLLADTLGIDLDTVMLANMVKLKERYPEQYESFIDEFGDGC